MRRMAANVEIPTQSPIPKPAAALRLSACHQVIVAELESKEQPVVLYCRSGSRSGRAAQMLKSAGYAQIHDLGAMSRW